MKVIFSWVQIGKRVGDKVLAKRDSHMVYNIGHPQIQGMVSCKLCEKCYNVNFAFLEGKGWETITSSFTSQAHVLQCKNQGMDDELPI
jgi:7-cyano-7-deazaguanine synthase in queuosine biosynthesis